MVVPRNGTSSCFHYENPSQPFEMTSNCPALGAIYISVYFTVVYIGLQTICKLFANYLQAICKVKRQMQVYCKVDSFSLSLEEHIFVVKILKPRVYIYRCSLAGGGLIVKNIKVKF